MKQRPSCTSANRSLGNGRKTRLSWRGLVRLSLPVAVALCGWEYAPLRAAETSDLMMELFLQKGMVTAEEAARIRGEAERIATNGPAATMPIGEPKLISGKGFKRAELFGDLRLRYERRSASDPSGHGIELDRFRYTARIGLRGELFDDFYYGIRLDPNGNPRSPWLSFGTSSSSGAYQGPFGKSTANLNLGQLYLGWRRGDWADITIGKMANPLYTTSMVWDPDINPEGLAERFKYTIGEADLFLTMGQFLYQDPNPVHASRGFFNLDYTDSSLPFLLTWQIGATYHVTKDVSVKVAPAVYYYTGHGVNTTSGAAEFPGFSGDYLGQGSTNGIFGGSASWSGYPNGSFDGFAANQTGIRDLLVLEIPLEVNYKPGYADFRLFGDFAKNLRGKDRADHAFAAQFNPLLSTAGLLPIPSPQTGEDTAWTGGLSVASPEAVGLVTGAATKRHGWEIRTYWQHVEQYALDPNMLDSDYFEGRANLEGVFAAAAFGLSDNLTVIFRYGRANRINNRLGTGGSNLDIPQMNPVDSYNIYQFDLSLKF